MFFQLHEFHEMLHPLYLTLLCEQGFLSVRPKSFFFFGSFGALAKAFLWKVQVL